MSATDEKLQKAIKLRARISPQPFRFSVDRDLIHVRLPTPLGVSESSAAEYLSFAEQGLPKFAKAILHMRDRLRTACRCMGYGAPCPRQCGCWECGVLADVEELLA